MEVISSFLAENYFWLLLIAIVLIMALIGYIADKKGLVKLSTKEDKKDTPPTMNNIAIPEINEIKVNDEVVKEVKNIEVPSEKQIEEIDFSEEIKHLGLDIFEKYPNEVKEIVPTFNDLNVPAFNDPVIEAEEKMADDFKDVDASSVDLKPIPLEKVASKKKEDLWKF